MADQDYSIPLKSNPVQIQNPLDLGVKAAQLSELQAIGAERRVETAQKQRAYDEQSVIRSAYQGSTTSDGQVDEQTLLSNLRSSRYPYLADQVAIKRADQRLDLQQKNQEFKLNAFHSITDQDSYDRSAKSLVDAGYPDIREKMGPYDPDPKSQFQRTLLNARISAMKDSDQIALQQKQVENYGKTLTSQAEAKKEGIPLNSPAGRAPGAPLVQGPEPEAPAPRPAPPAGAPPPSSVSPNTSKPGEYQLSKEDPAKAITNLPAAQKLEASKEVKDAQKIAFYAPDIITSLKNASDIKRDPIAAAQDFKNAKLMIGTTLKDLEGTTRVSAIQQLDESLDPTIWAKMDSKARSSLVKTAEKYLRGGQISPYLKQAGIDLDKYESTNVGAKLDKIPEFPARREGPHGPSVTQKGHKYIWNPEKEKYE